MDVIKELYNEIANQVLLLFKGGFNYLHYITFILGAIMCIVGIVQLKKRVIKGVFTIIATLFYTICFGITANNYASYKTMLVFFFASVILNLLIWLIVSRLGFKTSFGWLFGYVLVIVPAVIGGLLAESFPLSDAIIGQSSLLITSLLLSFLVPCIMNSSGGSGGHSSGNPFDEWGPGWGSVFRNWP